MPLEIVVGAQWGDEGKGRIVDLLSAKAEFVVRFNGGDNAGHTVTIGSKTYKLHQIPSGIIHDHTISLMGNGMVVNPTTLVNEIEMLRNAGIEVRPGRLYISNAAHIITPAHRALDKARELSLGSAQIGTTGRGIGPAYADKSSRSGLRMEEMLNLETFRQRLISHLQAANYQLEKLYQAAPLNEAEVVEPYLEYARMFAPFIRDTSEILYKALKEGKKVLAEGAQGALLDLDYGTYPFVTSSYCTASGALVGLGLGIIPVKRVIGIVKAFQTRVGSGSFPTELQGDEALRLRGTGSNPWDEYGTTTGRPRRVGWIDGMLLAYSARINGLTEFALTKLDILSGLPSIKICRAYRQRQTGIEYNAIPMGVADLTQYEPIYDELPGWQTDVQSVRHFGDLPAEARQFIQRIETLSGVPVRWVSVGPEREQVIQVDD